MESLSVRNMIKNRKLAKSIQDAAWSSLTGIIQYKATWYGKEVLKVGKFFASSKTCSNCNCKMDKMDLSVRVWGCPTCGANHDRDINAAKNILKEAMKNFHGEVSSAELTENRYGEDIRPKNFIQKANFDEVSNNTNHLYSFI